MPDVPPGDTPASADPFEQFADPDENGVVCLDIEMSRSALVWAYRRGMFPFPLRGVTATGTDRLAWVSPDPRAIFDLADMRMRRTTERSARRQGWVVTTDLACEAVIRACADRDEVWIDERFIDAYLDLRDAGLVHSIEVWEAGQLVGGVYGVLLGRLFFAESMFHRRSDAGKYALHRLGLRLESRGATWMDVQYLSDHLRTMGAKEIPRDEFLARLAVAVAAPQIDLAGDD